MMAGLIETLGPHFVKHHLNWDGVAELHEWPVCPVLHELRAPDLGDPHDHPWSFTTYIVAGSYVEEIVTFDTDGRWSSRLHTLETGTVHRVAADHVHRIVALPDGLCLTLVVYDRCEIQPTRFYPLDPAKRLEKT